MTLFMFVVVLISGVSTVLSQSLLVGGVIFAVGAYVAWKFKNINMGVR